MTQTKYSTGNWGVQEFLKRALVTAGLQFSFTFLNPEHMRWLFFLLIRNPESNGSVS